MRKLILLITLGVFTNQLLAHEGGHGEFSKEWKLSSKNQSFHAAFIKLEKDSVWLFKGNHETVGYLLKDFSQKDQSYILSLHNDIETVNREIEGENYFKSMTDIRLWLIILSLALIMFSVLKFVKQKKPLYLTFTGCGCLLFIISCGSSNMNSQVQPVVTNNLTLMQSVFGQFKNITTRSDDTYFYVSSNGIPEHNMMVGITNWQQQVPINQAYTDNNSWAIPIKPELSTNPLSMKTNLLKGAIAIAANGIPIFNPLNNRGEDANTIGELDQWGGHCGRADDYHYHLPPVHLQSQVGTGKPLAFAVDGFPVYGETTEQLDEYLGKVNADGSYQYHTIKNYPYFIASMRGKVTLDPNTTAPENQVLPQATTKGARPALTPLRDAKIVDFKSTGTNAYSLKYTINTDNYLINYKWDANNNYTYEFISPNGTSKIETYKR